MYKSWFPTHRSKIYNEKSIISTILYFLPHFRRSLLIYSCLSVKRIWNWSKLCLRIWSQTSCHRTKYVLFQTKETSSSESAFYPFHKYSNRARSHLNIDPFLFCSEIKESLNRINRNMNPFNQHLHELENNLLRTYLNLGLSSNIPFRPRLSTYPCGRHTCGNTLITAQHE